ncbi:DUF2062 domain-containing protein [Haloarcula rara]|uniref:DUF2062 domain-containing protein n=1 Tax=Haloarcula rara TaxID=3033387 RepID=UPI0023E75A84|nr:DUF2062 domain-containing protein [Halomicroarcula sp. SHR3]
MIRRRSRRTAARVRERLESAFLEDHSPRQVAASFSVGLFITALPTLGTGLLLFVLLATVFKQLSKIALFASVLVLNPPVKWGVYATSYWLGQRLLGPVPGFTFDGVTLSAGPDVLVRLWVGNLVLAAVFATVGYALALRLVVDFRARMA